MGAKILDLGDQIVFGMQRACSGATASMRPELSAVQQRLLYEVGSRSG
jgi:hypothetical protein